MGPLIKKWDRGKELDKAIVRAVNESEEALSCYALTKHIKYEFGMFFSEVTVKRHALSLGLKGHIIVSESIRRNRKCYLFSKKG